MIDKFILTPEQRAYVDTLPEEQQDVFKEFSNLPNSSPELALRVFLSHLPPPPPGLSGTQRATFLRVRNKISCDLHPNGGVVFSPGNLTHLELFALRKEILGTVPDELKEIIDNHRLKRKFNLSLVDDESLARQFSNTTVWIDPMPFVNHDAFDTQERTRDSLRTMALDIIYRINTGKNQKERAKRNRKPRDADGKSIYDVIATLSKQHPEDKPGELWPHLKARIEEWSGSDCNETRPIGKNRDRWLYTFTKPCSDTEDTIGYQAFRKTIKRLKTGN